MTQPVLSNIDIEEYYYVDTQAYSELKHEFVDGVMLAMTGGSPLHALLSGVVFGQLYEQLRTFKCRVYSSDLRVRAPKFNRVFHPDATVVCEKPVYDQVDRHGETLVNPLLVVEVLSKSTQRYDFETKLPAYQSIDSLRTILYVHQSKRAVEVWVKVPSGKWMLTVFTSGAFEVVGLSGVVLDVDTLYAQAGVK